MALESISIMLFANKFVEMGFSLIWNVMMGISLMEMVAVQNVLSNRIMCVSMGHQHSRVSAAIMVQQQLPLTKVAKTLIVTQ